MITKTAYELVKEALSKKEWKKQRAAERSVTQKKKVKAPKPDQAISTPKQKNYPGTNPVSQAAASKPAAVSGAKNVRMLSPKTLGAAGAVATAGGLVGHHLYKKHKNKDSD